MLFIDIIAGARPNFMKIAPIIRALDRRRGTVTELGYRLVHTGQHYDDAMSKVFFTQLGIPEPDINLAVGSGTQAEQAAAIMIGYEKLLNTTPSDLCLVVGDVTSTMACAIVAKKKHMRVAHVEAGIRSGDQSMPEEINRLVTDSITDLFFTTSVFANENLRVSGVSPEKVFFVGNTMIDTLVANEARLRQPDFWQQTHLSSKQYIVLTLHRPSNVDDSKTLLGILQAVGNGAAPLPVIFAVHPRTAKNVTTLIDIPENIVLVAPQPYLEFNYLVKHASAVITDSGGITEETTFLGIPCLTLRDSTERPETVVIGTNELVGTQPSAIVGAMKRLRAGQWKSGAIPENWDGLAGERIVEVLCTAMN